MEPHASTSIADAPTPLHEQSESSLRGYRSRQILHGGDGATEAVPAEPRHWVVPLDADGDARAALEFAKWLRGANAAHHFHGVHVPPAGGLGALGTDTRARGHLDEFAAREILDDIERTEPDIRPSDTLTELDEERLQGLIVTRRADSTDHALVRLGALVRRLAQQASIPVAIVPHDLRQLEVSNGPVLLAVAPEQTPAAAAVLTRQIAASKRLDVLLVNVAQVHDIGAYSGNAEAFREAYEAAEREAEAQTIMWAQQHDLQDAARLIVRGDVRFAVETAARRHDASVIICGTRQRSILHRLVNPSAALEIARYATRPVILVPRNDPS